MMHHEKEERREEALFKAFSVSHTELHISGLSINSFRRVVRLINEFFISTDIHFWLVAFAEMFS